MDECRQENECDVNAVCLNEVGSYSCECQNGFSGDGKTCKDLDECKQKDICANNAECTNKFGSYDCTCKSGYNGDGFSKCSDVNECLVGIDECSSDATCTNTQGWCLKIFVVRICIHSDFDDKFAKNHI